jgi:hypothetical protein
MLFPVALICLYVLWQMFRLTFDLIEQAQAD